MEQVIHLQDIFYLKSEIVPTGIIPKITKELNISMRTINLHGHDGIFNGTIDLYVHNTNDLNNLILNLMKLRGVEAVHRVDPHHLPHPPWGL